MSMNLEECRFREHCRNTHPSTLLTPGNTKLVRTLLHESHLSVDTVELLLFSVVVVGGVGLEWLNNPVCHCLLPNFLCAEVLFYALFFKEITLQIDGLAI